MASKRFHKINLEISNICNYQCSFCPEVERPKARMSKELFAKVLDQAAPLTDLLCFHLMGEPLTHPDLDFFLKSCEAKQVKVFLVSNGSLLSAEKHQVLLNPTIYQTNFSLHSFPDNFPHKDPSQYLQKIFTFVDQALQDRPEMYLNFRLWDLQEVRSAGAGHQQIQKAIEEHFGFQFPTQIDVRKKKSFRIQGRLYLHYDTQFDWPSMSLPVLGRQGTCKGLSNHIGILVEGTVVPCCLDKEGQIPLGRIQDQSLEAILKGSLATQLKQGFARGELIHPLCQRCQYIERFKARPSPQPGLKNLE
jgi:MoaA/NifB/PqqE/SkfB family radical SAM enzyme